MLQTPGSSPRRGSATEISSGNAGDVERGRNQSGSSDNYNGRNLTPRDHFQRHRPHPNQRQRTFLKNMGDIPSYYPPQIQEHGRWECSDGQGGLYVPRFGGPRGRGLDKDSIDFNSLPVLKQTHKFFDDMDASNGADTISEEKYRAQLRNFSGLPVMAHERIREIGNEIVACYTAQLCKFYNDSLIETTPNSYAVFTKKTRTGQRWLMVFRHERGRVNVSYNKLLTNQLIVRCLNPVSVEVEPARALCNTPQETCVFTFNGHSEANKFIQDIHESQTIVWNHREMLLEQTMRSQQEYYMEGPPTFGYCSPRPLSARSSSGYMCPPDIPSPLTPRMKVLPPVRQPRAKRSPFTVSARSTTPRADLDENWRGCENAVAPQPRPSSGIEMNTTSTNTPCNSVTQSPIRKRSKGSTKESFGTPIGGDGDFVYNSLTHSLALQQKQVPNPENSNNSSQKEIASSRRFQTSEVLVSNKRDVGTGAPDEEFSLLGSGEIQVIDNGDEQFDEIKCFSSDGQLLFSQILFGWNKVRTAEGSKNPKIRWWIGAAVLGNGNKSGGEAPRIREFKATFFDEDSANKFSELFHEGTVKGNNPDVRNKYLAQSLRL